MESLPDNIERQRSESELFSSMPLPALALCLLWWAFINPAAYTHAKTFPGLQQRFNRAANWLICTLLLAIPAIPLIGLTTGTYPLSERRLKTAFTPHHWLILLGIVWLVISLLSFFNKSKDTSSVGFFRTLIVGSIAFMVAILTYERFVMVFGGAFFAAFEDHLMTDPLRWHERTSASNFMGCVLGLLIAFVLMMVLATGVVMNGLALVIVVIVVREVNKAVTQQTSTLISMLTLAMLPIAYAALIWVYWLVDWQVLGI